jgi:hypothetical protein
LSQAANDPVVAAIRTLALEAFEHGSCSSAKMPFDSDLSPEAWAKKVADETAKQAAKVVAAETALLHAIILQNYPLLREAKEALVTLRYIGDRDAAGVYGLLARSHAGALADAIARSEQPAAGGGS